MDGWILTDDSELYRHKKTEEVEEDLQWGPFLGAEETPSAGRKNEGVPSRDGEGADEEVLLSGEMGREVEVGGEDVGEVWGRPRVCGVVGHGSGLPESRGRRRGDGGKDEDGTGEEKGEEETGRAWEGKVAVWRPKYTRRRR